MKDEKFTFTKREIHQFLDLANKTIGMELASSMTRKHWLLGKSFSGMAPVLVSLMSMIIPLLRRSASGRTKY